MTPSRCLVNSGWINLAVALIKFSEVASHEYERRKFVRRMIEFLCMFWSWKAIILIIPDRETEVYWKQL